VTLIALSRSRAKLSIKDDGPGSAEAKDSVVSGQNLGMRIIQGLAEQIEGNVTIILDHGTEVAITFPTNARVAETLLAFADPRR
jgi:two-component sensor histidine kinase